MFERLQKPFLTVETGEAYQPIRLTYELLQKDKLFDIINKLQCCEKKPNKNAWEWFWQDECSDLRFDSIESFKRNPHRPPRLGTLTTQENKLYLNLPSFKRACLAVSFFHRVLDSNVVIIKSADFINKVFGIDERLPHGFSELFEENELNKIVQQRISDYEKIQTLCEHAPSAKEALKILSDYTKAETEKRLPYAERYAFQLNDVDMEFLSFYIFLRSRELVAIHRWFGETNYTLTSAADETIEQVFGNMDIDIIE
jgi:hypothetical protein